MTQGEIERHQVWIYLAAIALGLLVGALAPGAGPGFEAAIWPALMALLTVSFALVPLDELPAAVRDRRFIAAILAGNFVVVPFLVALLLPFAPDDPAVRLGVLLVLLVPCTDWFITFAQLGRGDDRRALAATPVLLLAQFALLPVYLWFFMGESFEGALPLERVVTVFLLLIALPLAVAYGIERASARRGTRAKVVKRLARFPIPLLALVIFLIAAGQAEAVVGASGMFARLAPVFVLYLAGAVAIAMALARIMALPEAQGRTLVFSLATRNSFVVLPFALALPASWELAVLVIVFQSVVELFGMVALVRLVPLWLMPARAG